LPSADVIELLGGWEGCRVAVVQRFPPGQYGPQAEVWIELRRDGSPFNCSGYRLLPWAAQFWREWYARALRSRIEPLKKFARQLNEKLAGVLAHCTYPLHTSLLEGINNKIKVIKRMAYGFRDHEYFFLKIRAAFPGKAG